MPDREGRVRGRDEIRSEILAYLAAHPDSEETLEGIAEWWLLERSIERRLREVRAALEGLVADGLLERRARAGSAPRYRIRDEAKSELRQQRPARERKAP
jgi:hypothetical protein